MKRIIKLNIIALVIMIIMAPTIVAQQNQTRNRVVEELSKSDRIIEQARTAIERSNTAYDFDYLRIANRQAEELVKKAVTYQNQAKALFVNSYVSIADLAYGEKLTGFARDLALKAIAIKKRAEGKAEENENTVLRQLEKTDRLIDRIRDNSPSNVPDRLKSGFDTALDNQKRAWELFRERSLRASLKLSRQAEKSLQKLAERLKSGTAIHHRLENRILRTEQKLEQVRFEIMECESEQARNLIGRANKNIEDCYRLLSENKLERARNLLNRIQRLINNAAGLCSSSASLPRAVKRIETEIANKSDLIIRSGNEAAIKLLESARRHLKDASDFCREGENDACAASIKAAQMNFRKALKLTGN